MSYDPHICQSRLRRFAVQPKGSQRYRRPGCTAPWLPTSRTSGDGMGRARGCGPAQSSGSRRPAERCRGRRYGTARRGPARSSGFRRPAERCRGRRYGTARRDRPEARALAAQPNVAGVESGGRGEAHRPKARAFAAQPHVAGVDGMGRRRRTGPSSGFRRPAGRCRGPKQWQGSNGFLMTSWDLHVRMKYLPPVATDGVDFNAKLQLTADREIGATAV